MRRSVSLSRAASASLIPGVSAASPATPAVAQSRISESSSSVIEMSSASPSSSSGGSTSASAIGSVIVRL